MNITIRSAAPDDASAIAEVRVVTWRATYRGLIPDPVLDELDITKEADRYHEGIAKLPPEQSFLVAEVDMPRRRVVGYAIFGPDRDPNSQETGEIYALYVLPDYQGLGIGRSLVSAAKQELAERGFHRLIIFVLSNNTPSRMFYEAVGGKVEREKTIEIQGFQAEEVGYGYGLGEPSHLP